MQKILAWLLSAVLLILSACTARQPAALATENTDFSPLSLPEEQPASTAIPSAPLSGPTDPWYLLLVNAWHPLSEDFSVTLTQLKNGHAVDSRAYPKLQEMIDTMRAQGLSPVICSSYRTAEKQQTLYTNKVDRYLAEGYAPAQAKQEAANWVAVPGTSEHQTGLAVDIVDLDDQILDAQQEHTAVQQWLMAHAWEYGFILRYPSHKSHITGIDYEPWHYRYVEPAAAKEMFQSGLCLEEYLESIAQNG